MTNNYENNYINKSESVKEKILEKFKNNKIFKSYLKSIKYANISKNNWFLMAWTFGKGGCLSPIDTFFNIYIIISIQVLINQCLNQLSSNFLGLVLKRTVNCLPVLFLEAAEPIKLSDIPKSWV